MIPTTYVQMLVPFETVFVFREACGHMNHIEYYICVSKALLCHLNAALLERVEGCTILGIVGEASRHMTYC